MTVEYGSESNGAGASGVRVCSTCGEENPTGFRLCGYCGTAFPDAAAPAETRKTVTIVFCDLKGSTPLGEALDPEALREVVTRYFGEMRAAIEAHGGSIEKFIGDAVMAVFGVPKVREDDALRAVRATADMQHRLAVLNEELERRWGVRIANRTGVNTGELVAGNPVAGQRLVIGDAVNVAARLEQAAPENEVLLGERTYRLVKDCVEVEEMPPLELKGKSEPVPAYRLCAVRDGEALPRHHERAHIGREGELATLLASFDAAVDSGHARLATVLGAAGMGKSRLAKEFIDSIGDRAEVAYGRCLPYGRGITFWPLVEIAWQLAGIGDDDPPDLAFAKLAAVAGPDGEAAAERVGSAVGLSDREFPIDEIQWGARKLFEHLASRRPLVLVFDDIHWAELTLLDLIAHVAESTGAPLLVLCLARQDLLELRPDWARGPDDRRLPLAPLSYEATGRIIENALGRGSVADDVRRQILEAAEGNPLFVEQMLSMLVDDGTLLLREDRWELTVPLSTISVPPTIQALLAARVDHLHRDERDVLQPASVIGTVFPREAVEALVHESLRPAVPGRLQALAAKQLVRPDSEALGGDDAHRFEHVLIRDAVYQRLLKRTRAELHEHFADWGEQMMRERARELEFEEILGYHLEQAHGYLAELGPHDGHGEALGRRAAGRLASAGRRAFGRGDMPAAANLLRRATGLMPERDPERLELLCELAEALGDSGEFAVGEAFLLEALALARDIGDRRLEARADVALLQLRGQAGDPERWADEAVRRVEGLLPLFDGAGDDAGAAAACRLLAWAHGTGCRYGYAAAAAQRAVELAETAGDGRQRRRAATQYAVAAVWGPTPVDEAIDYCGTILGQTSGDRRTHGLVTSLLARLEAMRGDFDRARELSRDARAALEDMGTTVVAASTSLDSCGVEMLAGNPAGAASDLQRDYALLKEMGEKYLLSTVAAELARALAELGEDRDADDYAGVAESLAADDDLATQALWRSSRARVLARAGDIERALVLATDATELLAGTDSLVAHGDALLVLAEVLGAAGCPDQAERASGEALALYERKGDVVSADRAHALLVPLRA